MKKTLLLIPIIAMLAACGTTDKYGKIAEQEQKARVKSAERFLIKHLNGVTNFLKAPLLFTNAVLVVHLTKQILWLMLTQKHTALSV